MKPIFSPTYGTTEELTAASSSSSVALADFPSDSLLVTNSGSNIAFIKLGGSDVEATSEDLPILPGSAQTISRNHETETHAAVISSEGTTVLVTLGYGV